MKVQDKRRKEPQRRPDKATWRLRGTRCRFQMRAREAPGRLGAGHLPSPRQERKGDITPGPLLSVHRTSLHPGGRTRPPHCLALVAEAARPARLPVASLPCPSVAPTNGWLGKSTPVPAPPRPARREEPGPAARGHGPARGARTWSAVRAAAAAPAAEAAPRVTLPGSCGSARCALSGKAGRSGPGRWARAGGPGGAPPPPRLQASLRLGRPEGGGPTSWCLTFWLWLPLENQCPTLGPGPRGLASLFRGQSARASPSGPRGSLAGGGFKSCIFRWAEGLGRGVLCFHEWPCR